MNSQKPDRDGLLREMEAYQDTIYMVEIFCSYLKKRYQAECQRGRTMHPRGRPDRNVKPDFALAAQDLSIVGEAKYHVTKERRGQTDIAEQIGRYCSVLCWPDGRELVHDVTVLTSAPHVGRLSGLLERSFGGGSVRNHKLSVMGFSQERGEHESFQLTLKWGNFTQPGLTKRARSGLSVEARHAIVELNRRWFSDSKPPVLYTMSLIWERILPHMIKDPDDAGGMKAPVTITIDTIEDAVKKFSYSAPRRDWIWGAMEGLVEIGKAKRSGSSYTVRYRQISHPRKKFAEMWAKKLGRRNRRSANQTLPTGDGLDRA